tara:strand:+ start:212 stop:493 length:282 start_codon:yes stop_codon:yes gene_type:complete
MEDIIHSQIFTKEYWDKFKGENTWQQAVKDSMVRGNTAFKHMGQDTYQHEETQCIVRLEDLVVEGKTPKTKELTDTSEADKLLAELNEYKETL